MKITFTRHVLLRMKERKISKKLVVEAIIDPELVKKQGRYVSFYKRTNKVIFIRVIAIISEETTHIIYLRLSVGF